MIKKMSILLLMTLMINTEDFIQVGTFVEQIYQGEWKSSQKQVKEFIKSNSGMMYLQLIRFPFQKDNKLFFLFLFREDKFLDKHQVFGRSEFVLTDQHQKHLIGFTNTTNIEKSSKIFISNGFMKDCEIKSSLVIKDKDGKEYDITTDEKVNIIIEGNISSNNCDINFAFLTKPAPYYIWSILIFTLLAILFTVMGFYPFYMAVKLNNIDKIKNISGLTFFSNILVDVVLTTINMTFAMRLLVDYFEFLILIMMFQIISVLFKIRIYLEIFERNLQERNLEPNGIAKAKFIFLMKFIIGIVFAVVLGNYLIVYYYLFIILFLYPLFQIFHNCFNVVQKHCFYLDVHLFIFSSQLFYPIVLRTEIFEFFLLQRDIIFVLLLISIQIFFLFLMFLQKHFGRNFFLPKFLLPNYYNYFKKISTLNNEDNNQCPICFCDLKEAPEESKKTGLIVKTYMRTPCSHNFHVKCLKQWMDNKLLCPNCRATLPPY